MPILTITRKILQAARHLALPPFTHFDKCILVSDVFVRGATWNSPPSDGTANLQSGMVAQRESWSQPPFAVSYDTYGPWPMDLLIPRPKQLRLSRSPCTAQINPLRHRAIRWLPELGAYRWHLHWKTKCLCLHGLALHNTCNIPPYVRRSRYYQQIEQLKIQTVDCHSAPPRLAHASKSMRRYE